MTLRFDFEKAHFARLALVAALATGYPPPVATAQTAAPPGESADADQPDEEHVELSLFVVSATSSGIGRYDSLESISAGRVRMDIMDSAQSISVLTTEVIEDVAAGRVVDATRFIAGVTDATLPTSWEFTFMRGFLSEGRTVDGITYGAHPSSGFHNIDPAIIERIEVVKGPNSILAPRPTSPGGTANMATKQPQFRDFGRIGVQFGRFDANSGSIDINRVAGDRLAFRFVGSVRAFDHWWQDAWVRSTTLMPAFTWRVSEKTQATLQYTYTDWDAQNYFGLPIDPSSGTTTGPARLLAGVPRDLNVFPDDAVRTTRQHEIKLLVTSELWRGIQMRLMAAYCASSQHLAQLNTGLRTGTGSPGGAVDPLTGRWNPGFTYAQVPPYPATSISTPPSRIFNRAGNELFAEPRQFNLQNDYAHVFERGSLKSTALAGFAWAEQRNDDSRVYTIAAAPPVFNIDAPVATSWARVAHTVNNRTNSRFAQFYAAETLALFRGRLILNAAGSWQEYRDRVDDRIRRTTGRAHSRTALPSYGVVIKPRGDTVSLYYGHTEQSSSNGVSTTAAIPPLSTSRQDEFGARFKLWDNRLYFTASHYDIFQANFSTPNPGNLVPDPPNPPLPNLFSDRSARGWEYELRANPVRGLSIIAAYTHYRNRDRNGVEFRGVAERAGSLLASYAFDGAVVPALDGFRIAVAVDHVGNRAGDSVTEGFTAASTPASPIPIQPSFYLGSRTLVNLTLAYDPKRRWSAQLNVDNLLDREYLQSSVTRFAVFPGPPRNFRFSVRYDF